MRAVIDTNVLLSGLLWHGAPHALLERVRSSALGLVSSPALLAELAEVAGRAKFDSILTRTHTSQVDLIVSGDNDLLALGAFDGIPVLTPAQALQRIPRS